MSDRPPSNFYKDPPRKWPKPKKAVASNRVDTKAYRQDAHEGTWSVAGWFALCDELDRTREAAERVCELRFDESPSGRLLFLDALDRLAAALAESGNTERCPTCRSEVRWKRGWMVFDTPCWDPWHRAADTEGER